MVARSGWSSVVVVALAIAACSSGKHAKEGGQAGSGGAGSSAAGTGVMGGASGAMGGASGAGGGAAGAGDQQAPHTTASPDGADLYQQPVSVTLMADEAGAKTYYTLDGSEPTEQSAPSAGPIELEETTTLKFFSVDGAGNREATTTVTYRIDIVRILLLQTGAL
jgi:hypothetical protein